MPVWPDQPLLSGAKELWHDAAWLVVLRLASSNHTLEAVKRGRKVSSMDTHPWGRRGQSSAWGREALAGGDPGRPRSPLTSSQFRTVITLIYGCSVPQSEAVLVCAFGSTGGAEDQVSWHGKANGLVAMAARVGRDAKEAVKDKVTQARECPAEVPELAPNVHHSHW